ncbi:ribosomal protein L7/L12 [Streptomyces glaucescens]|uniref:ribosomal protein L7/L12 n=1 Tax=Streptomyces glaucescens TaxID=1907 RepID=UPI001FCCBD13|nr:ribosomal protein L7/L12 [Streptomyces glaucescens]
MDSVALPLIALIVCVAVFGHEARFSRLDKRLARLERKVDLLLGHLDVAVEDPGTDAVAALARDGKAIEAIKEYRRVTGAGLKEAKDAVDRLQGR